MFAFGVVGWTSLLLCEDLVVCKMDLGIAERMGEERRSAFGDGCEEDPRYIKLMPAMFALPASPDVENQNRGRWQSSWYNLGRIACPQLSLVHVYCYSTFEIMVQVCT